MNLCEEINTINKIMADVRELYAHWCQKAKIPPIEFNILYLLTSAEDITQRTIRTKYQLPKQTVNNAIKSMQSKGYIVLKPGNNDRREKQVVLTESGNKLCTRTVLPMLQIEEQVMAQMGTESVKQMINSMANYRDTIKNVMKEKLK